MKKEIYEAIIDAMLHPLKSGSSRQVFTMEHDKTKVLKVAPWKVRQSVVEAEVWESFSMTDEGKQWLAKVFDISEDGRVMVQERLQIITDVNDPRLPEKVPRCMTDLKVNNWGVAADGTVKCCDYGTLLLLQERPWMLCKAEWWTEADKYAL